MNKKALFRTWGEYFNYPQCCIDSFCDANTKHFTSNHPYAGSGFIPCKKCFNKTIGLSLKQANKKLGINVINKPLYLSTMYSDTLRIVKSDKFKSLAEKYDLDYEDYVNALKSNIKIIKGE